MAKLVKQNETDHSVADDLIESLAKGLAQEEGWNGESDEEFNRIFAFHKLKIYRKARDILMDEMCYITGLILEGMGEVR